MQRYVLNRLVQALAVIWLVSVFVFILARLSGDPLALLVPAEATKQEMEEIKKQYGFDKPLYDQYWIFISRALKGDLGNSLRMRQPALDLYFQKLPATLELAGASFFLAILVGLPVGVFSAIKPGGKMDRFGKILALLGQSTPAFWVGIMIILLLSVNWKLLPAGGRDEITSLLMPAFTLGWYSMAAMTRLTRSGMLDVLDSEYIKLARIKGVPEILVIIKHAFKNAAIPILTFMSLQLIILLSGSIIVEVIFAWPGIGTLAVNAIFARDYPVIQTIVLITSVLYILTNLGVDILYAVLDPRIRYR